MGGDDDGPDDAQYLAKLHRLIGRSTVKSGSDPPKKAMAFNAIAFSVAVQEGPAEISSPEKTAFYS